MINRWIGWVRRTFPEQRLFLKSDDGTRFLRLSTQTQVGIFAGGAVVLGWTIFSTSVMLMDSLGSGTAREQALRDQANFEARLNELSDARDSRAAEALAAQERFSAALQTISGMQSRLLASEEKRRELETGIEIVQGSLRRTTQERDNAKAERLRVESVLAGTAPSEDAKKASPADIAGTLDFLTTALDQTATERDEMAAEAATAREDLDVVAFERELILDRNDKIFSQLEEALTVSVSPLDRMFRAAGLPPDRLIETVRKGYSGQGGPLTPLSFSTMGIPLDPDSARANTILKGLDNLNLYRIAAQKAPFALPVKSSFRFTSGFGPRWGRMHNGTDFAASHGTPIYSTADGVIIHAGWLSGYGRLIKIQHEFGIETRYAHLAKIRVNVGQRVSRGDRIGDMGNSGRSTGTHLHYEVRVGGKPVNPMTYIKAAQDVF